MTRITGECGRLADGISRTSAELAHLTERLATVETPDHPLGSRIEPVLAELKAVMERLDRRAEERVEREAEAAATLSAAVQALGEMTRHAELAVYRGRPVGKPKGVPDAPGPRRLWDRLSEWGTKAAPSGRRRADEKGRG